MANSEIELFNATPYTIFVATCYYEPSCGEPDEGDYPWKVEGWWKLSPFKVKVVANPNDGKWFFVHARTQWTGGKVWPKDGTDWCRVRPDVFQFCYGIGMWGGDWKWVRFHRLNAEEYDGVNFLAS
jgi:hypothetical protein